MSDKNHSLTASIDSGMSAQTANSKRGMFPKPYSKLPLPSIVLSSREHLHRNRVERYYEYLGP